MLLSGDQPGAANAMGATLGFAAHDIFADVKPGAKQDKIRELQGEGATVAMVGDGVNDTAALAQADVGIAMGGGVQAASDVSDVLLLGNAPTQVCTSRLLGGMLLVALARLVPASESAV